MDPLALSLAAAVASAVAAVVSASAAAIALAMQMRTTRPRLHVELRIARVISTVRVGEPFVSIEVANTGLLPVDVTSVGLVGHRGQLGHLFSTQDASGRTVIPTRLEPQQSISVVGSIAEAHKWQQTRGLTGVYAMTAAGKRFKGNVTDPLPRQNG